MTIATSTHRADYSEVRRETALRYLQSEVVTSNRRPMSRDAIELLVVSLLVCNDSGFISRAAVDSAMQDESAVNAARAIIAKAGL